MLRKLSSKLFSNPKRSGLEGSIDGVYSGKLTGWVFSKPHQFVEIDIAVNGTSVGTCLADQPRMDLASSKIGDGRHGFAYVVPKEFAVALGDKVEIIDSSNRRRKISLRITKRVLGRTMGEVEYLTASAVGGWIYLPWAPQTPCTIQVYLDDRVIGTGVADIHRESAGEIGPGRHGFHVPLHLIGNSASVLPRIRIRCLQTGRLIPFKFSDWVPDLRGQAASLTTSPHSTVDESALVSRVDALLRVYRDEFETQIASLRKRVLYLEEQLARADREPRREM